MILKLLKIKTVLVQRVLEQVLHILDHAAVEMFFLHMVV